jgi:hypothetical protein
MVDCDHVGAARNQLLGIEARTAARIEHAPTCHLADQVEHSWPVIPRVVRAVASVILEVLSELIEDRTAVRTGHGNDDCS